MARGFKGFFDVDGLSDISEENLKETVRKSCTLIIVLSDETCLSPWCLLEWQTARDAHIPARCVADVQCFIKADMVEQVKNQPDVTGHLLRYQFIEYTDASRKAAVSGIERWFGDLYRPPQDASLDSTPIGRQAA